MKYENGKDIFPEELLKQIQKYVSGKVVYIPSCDKKREWGESSGYKQYLIERNRDIRAKIVWITEKHEYDLFKSKYCEYLS